MKYIFIKTQFEGYHKWKDAPEETKFLRNLHRHIFGVKVKVSVNENDREIEYFDLKNSIDLYLSEVKFPEIYSCEMMAEDILDFTEGCYYKNKISIEVNEDNQNGSIVDNYEGFEGGNNE